MVGTERWSLARPTALLAIAAILPLLVFAAVGAGLALERQHADMDDRLIADARRISERVDRELTANLEAVQDLAEQPSLDTPVDLAAFAEIALRQQNRHPLWRTVLLLDGDGDRLVNSAAPDKLGPAVELSSALAAFKSGKPLIGSMAKGVERFGIPVRAPVIRNGQVKYIVTVVIAPDQVHRVLASTDVPEGWIATVVDQSGRIVARNRNEARYIGVSASRTSREIVARSQSGVYRGRSLDGVPVLSSFWRSPDTGWTVHIGLPLATFEAPLRRSLLFTGLGLGLSVLLAGLFVVLLLREQRLRRREAAAVEQAQRLEALGRLTGGVAHDFNNLLMIIQGNVDILRRRIIDGVGEKQLTAIRVATDRASRLTRELLVFARGGAATKSRIDVNGVIRNFIGSLEASVGPMVSVELALDPAAPVVEADRVQLEMAVLNLAVNARDSMAGVGTLTITTRVEGGAVQIIVGDTGAGFSDADLPRVFDPFFTTKLASGGTGLGLTQVYSFARQAGGGAKVENRKSGGAQVILSLPRSAAAPEQDEEAVVTSSETLRGRRILLVDDNEAVRHIAANYLRELGVLVIEASDAVEALQQLNLHAFDGLLSDIVMPGPMDGLGLAMQAAARRPRIPVLLVSGYSASIDEARAKGLRVLSKPYELPDLARELARAITTSETVADSS